MSDFGSMIATLLGGDSSAVNAASAANQPAAPNASNGAVLVPATPAATPKLPDAFVIPNLHQPANLPEAQKQSADFAMAGFNTQLDAARQVSGIVKQAAQAQDDVYSQTIKAYNNIKRTERFPHGIARIMGLFDSDWNLDYQKTNVEEAVVKGQQITERAKSQIDIANMIPDLIAKAGGVSDKLLKDRLEGDNYNLALLGAQQRQEEISVQRRNSDLEAARTRVEMDADHRAQAQFQVDGLGEADAATMLKDAQTNPKSKYRGIAGLLQQHLVKSEEATASLQSAQTAAARGDMELHDKQMQIFTNNLPSSQLAFAYDQAQKSGSPTVTFGAGTKSPITVPFGYVTNALNTQKAQEITADHTLAQQAADDANIGSRTTQAIGSAAMAANADPRAAAEVQALRANLHGLGDKPAYPQIIQYKNALNISQQRLDAIYADIAGQYSDKTAQAAIKAAGSNGGKFTSEGGQAVAEATAGNYAATRSSPYADAWGIYNAEIARQLQKAQSGGSGVPTSTQMTAADVMQMMVSGKSNPKFTAIAQQVLADPDIARRQAASMQEVIKKDAVYHTLVGLAQGKNASPVWRKMLTERIDANKLIDQLEQERVLSGGKVDYSNTFINALRSYGVNVDTAAMTDPRYAIADRALEAARFGTRPHSAVVGSEINNLLGTMAKTRGIYEQRIQQDKSGETVARANALEGNVAGASPFMRRGEPNQSVIDKRPPATSLNTPSATGLKLSAHEMSTLWGGQ